MKEFRDPRSNRVIATAEISDNYLIGAALNDQAQNARVPFTYSIFAIDNKNGISIYALSEEVFSDFRNKAMEKMSLMVNPSQKKDIRDLLPEREYLKQFAESITQTSLTEKGIADLPDYNTLNMDATSKRMADYYNNFFYTETMGGMECQPNNTTYKGIMVRYSGIKDNNALTVVAGMDFKGIEYYYPGSQMLMGGMNYLFGGALNGTKGSQEGTSTEFGKGKCDIIEWGAEARYLLIAPVEKEDEAVTDFMKFVTTYRPTDEIMNDYENRKLNALNQALQANRAYQAQTQVNIAGLQYNQAKLTNMLANNSASISAGIMDSWNKKMASDSRISQARSEAIRGVNTYTNKYGQNVDVSVAADHVYQNQYGDVYGVSGNAIDQDVLTRINWTEIKK